MPTKMRLNKLIAQASELSRRAADEAIAAGAVSVNGAVVTVVGTTVDPRHDRVKLNGRLLQIDTGAAYIAFHKPRGYLVTKSDPKGRSTIWDILTKYRDRMNAVGRLDYDSEGLLLITNDGDFLYRLTHPKHEIGKLYQVKVRGEATEAAVSALAKGVDLKEGRTAPARVRVAKMEEGSTWLEIEIHEGRNRQIRRMCEAVDLPVIRLRRVAIGPLKLGRLKRGEWRMLKGFEVKKLTEASRR